MRRTITSLLWAPPLVAWVLFPQPLPAQAATTSPILEEIAKLLPSDGREHDYFGLPVAVSDGRVVAGSHQHNHDVLSGSAYLFERDEAGSWAEVAELLPSDGTLGDDFGRGVAISGDAVVVGARHHDELGTNAGSAYVFERDEAGSWHQVAKLLAADGTAGDQFGHALALSGKILVVGARFADGQGSSSGAAYVFERDAAGTWSEAAKLLPSDGEEADIFGYSVAVSGATVVVGAYGHDDRGSAYVFEPDAVGKWSEVAALVASDAALNDDFGVSVAVDADRVAVGAEHHDDQGTNTGAAYLFERDAEGRWTEVAKLLASDRAGGDRFGSAVALDGDTVVVGAILDDDGGTNSGSAYAFEREEAGTWSQVAKLLPSDLAIYDNFGQSVAVSGETLVVGSYVDDDLGINSGSAYVFSLAGPLLAGSDLCLDAAESCNDYFLSRTPLSPGLWALRGYEYGCGQDTRLVIGTMRLAGSSLHVGLTGSNGAVFASGQLYQRNYVIDAVSRTGTYDYVYTYLDGGALRASDGSGSATLATCADPGFPGLESQGPDELRRRGAPPTGHER